MVKKKSKSFLRDIILGGQDGLVNVLGLSLGLVAAHASNHLILVAGLAAGFSEAISMGAVAYTSVLADKNFYLKTKKLITEEYEEAPHIEREEIEEVYENMGFKGRILETIVDQVMKDKEILSNTLLSQYYHMQKIDEKGIVFSSVIVGISALIGSLIPLVPFFWQESLLTIFISVSICAVILFVVGAYEALTLVGSWWKSGLQMLFIGMCCAFAGFLIGLVLKIN